MTQPTDRQREILTWMREYQAQHGMPPTIREIGVAPILMERKGLVTHRPSIARGAVPRSPMQTGEVR